MKDVQIKFLVKFRDEQGSRDAMVPIPNVSSNTKIPSTLVKFSNSLVTSVNSDPPPANEDQNVLSKYAIAGRKHSYFSLHSIEIV